MAPDLEGPSWEAASWTCTAVILVIFMALFYWAWNAPSRELSRRTPEGAPLTKEQARALAFSEITYGNLTLAALMGAGLIWKMSTETDVFHGWGLIWPVLGGGLIVLAGFQAIRKWRLRQ
jgi:hypothetical protein